MVEINNLSYELLETIFQDVPLYTRLACKEVCRRWNEILMKSVKFHQDRHIYLQNCIIHPKREPWNIFIKAKYPYQYLTICKNNEELNMCPFPVDWQSKAFWIPFWMHLGKTVTEVTFKTGVSDRMMEILRYMPSVKTIILGDYILFCCFRSIMEKNERLDDVPVRKRTSLKNTKMVCIDLIEFDNQSDFFEKIDMLEEYITKNVEYTIKKISCEDPQATSILLYSLKSLETVSNKPGLPFECLGFKVESLDALYHLDFQQLNFKELHLEVDANQELSIPLQISKLTEISIYGNIDKQSFKVFEILDNLKSLELQTTRCYTDDSQIFHYFGHESVNLPKLKELKLAVPFNCEACVEALSASFPNLVKFKNTNKEMLSLQTIGLRLNNWQHLEEFSVSTTSFKSFECISSDIKKPNLNLRSLTIMTEAKLTKHKPQDFTTLSKVFPNLHTLCCNGHQDLTELLGVLKEILDNFHHLTTLQFFGSTEGPVSHTMQYLVIRILTQFGQKIRVLELPAKEFCFKEFEEKTRLCMKNLCLQESDEEHSDDSDNSYY